MAVKVLSACYTGIDGNLINVEVEIFNSLPYFAIVGLGDAAVREAKERVHSAIVNSGFEFPDGRIVVNLSPADIKKNGSLFDLPMAIGVLIATNQINYDTSRNLLFIGELSLSGEINKVKGTLPSVLSAVKQNINKIVLPQKNAVECSIIKDVNLYPFNTLLEVCNFLNGEDIKPFKYKNTELKEYKSSIDFSDVFGQESTKRALEIASAGGHNVLMFGPPGSGKTMLAKLIPTILPKLTYEESLEITKLYSVAGALNEEYELINERPFRSPHHTASKVALVGGGSNLCPGEISLCHHGVLFLDELLEFDKPVLEVLRQPLEEKCISVTRVTGSVTYPANFMLIGALNPCPCGNLNCVCSINERKRYLNKLSKPLLDRIDIFSFVNTIDFKEINFKNVPSKSETSKDIRNRVETSRKLQLERFKEDNITTNSQMDINHVKKYCTLSDESLKTIEAIYNKFSLSTRAYIRILKVSRTIADLSQSENIEKCHIIEALNYRKFINEKII